MNAVGQTVPKARRRLAIDHCQPIRVQPLGRDVSATLLLGTQPSRNSLGVR